MINGIELCRNFNGGIMTTSNSKPSLKEQQEILDLWDKHFYRGREAIKESAKKYDKCITTGTKELDKLIVNIYDMPLNGVLNLQGDHADANTKFLIMICSNMVLKHPEKSFLFHSYEHTTRYLYTLFKECFEKNHPKENIRDLLESRRLNISDMPSVLSR